MERVIICTNVLLEIRYNGQKGIRRGAIEYPHHTTPHHTTPHHTTPHHTTPHHTTPHHTTPHHTTPQGNNRISTETNTKVDNLQIGTVDTTLTRVHEDNNANRRRLSAVADASLTPGHVGDVVGSGIPERYGRHGRSCSRSCNGPRSPSGRSAGVAALGTGVGTADLTGRSSVDEPARSGGCPLCGRAPGVHPRELPEAEVQVLVAVWRTLAGTVPEHQRVGGARIQALDELITAQHV